MYIFINVVQLEHYITPANLCRCSGAEGRGFLTFSGIGFPVRLFMACWATCLFISCSFRWSAFTCSFFSAHCSSSSSVRWICALVSISCFSCKSSISALFKDKQNSKQETLFDRTWWQRLTEGKDSILNVHRKRKKNILTSFIQPSPPG